MVWLIGNRGMLGSDVERLLRDRKLRFTGTDLEIDITNIEELRKYTTVKSFKWVINCAAYTNVDKAEEEREKAFKINADGVLNIAKIAQEIQAKLIHISTDYIFDGKKEAYTETDLPNPQNVYGESKLKGERNIEATISEHFILRTAWLYGVHGNNFVHTMLKLFNERSTVKVVSDQWGSPTYTLHLAQAILTIINSGNSEYGIYNATNEGRTSWYEFAHAIYKSGFDHGFINKKVEILPIESKDYPSQTVRPKYSYLSKLKFKSTFGSSLPDWQDGLKSFFSNLVQTKGATQ